MKIFTSFEEAGYINNPVVTIGSFDGVHIGHKAILDRLKSLADKYNGESVLITFDPHPRKVLYSDTAGKGLKLITSGEEKLFLLEKAGIDNIIIVRFTREFSQISSHRFVSEYLYEKLHAKVIVVGFNHHFGFNKEGDYRKLWEWQKIYDFEAVEIPEQEVEHETVSSSKIRQAISEGYIQKANAYLDHYYVIMGKPEVNAIILFPGSMPFFRLLVQEECKLLPSAGIYAVTVYSESFASKGMVIINDYPDRQSEVLVNIFDNLKIDPSKNISLNFHKKILGAVNLSDMQTVSKINLASEEIADLIY
jgi:riboflavin kinase / FMN adenylyltransferase